jgi:integrase/recombinase XerD
MKEKTSGTAHEHLRSSRSVWSPDTNPSTVSVDALCRSFFRRLRSDGRSPATIARYELVLRQFVGHAEAVGYPWPPAAEHIADYLASQRDDGKAKNTVRNSHVALRAFFNWLHEEGEVAENPMTRLKTPSLDNVSPDPYSDEEVRAMLAACRGRGWLECRDAAIIGVLADTGLRASEFCSLTVEDVELDAERIRIVGKGGRHRCIGLGAAAQTLLDRYLRRRPSHRSELWLGRAREPITSWGLYQIIERIASAANVQRKGIHRFRHYAATAMLRSGMGELDLARFMGWSTLAMAQRYTRHEAQERALKAHKAHSPLDRLQ